MLKDITLIQWFNLLLSLVMFIGPGMGIISLLNTKRKVYIISIIVISFALSISMWTITLTWTKIFAINILNKPIIFIISILGWIIAIQKKSYKLIQTNEYKREILIWFGIIASVIINLYSLRHMVAGLGSDSYHHTLIATLFLNNHEIPSNYQPYVDHIITFNYHFGYHAFIAIISLFCNIEPRLLILISGPILVGLSALSIIYFISTRIGLNLGIIIAAYIPTLISVFPTALLLWGRYPQLMGLFILPILLSEYFLTLNNPSGTINLNQIVLIGILSAGLLFTHYRVTFMGIVAIIIIESIFVYQQHNKDKLKYHYFLVLLIGELTFFFTLPWLLQVWNNLHVGYPAQKFIGNSQSFFSLARLGNKVIYYPTNAWILITLFLLILLLVVLKKRIDIFIVWMIFWTLILLGISKFVGRYSVADPVTVVISLYLPLTVIISISIAQIIDGLRLIRYKYLIYFILFLAVIFSGIRLIGFLDQPEAVYVFPEDLKAIKWIKNHIPEDTYFMINTYAFDFSPAFIIGIDAGGWLPLLAGMKVPTLPMTYSIERFDSPNNLQEIVNLHESESNLETIEALELLQTYKIKYIYIGKKGGLINPDKLNQSGFYNLIYQKENVYVYKVKYPSPH